MIISPQPIELLNFKRVTHAHYIAYTLSNSAMSELGEKIATTEGVNPGGLFQVGKLIRGERSAFAEMSTEYVLQGLEKDGLFSSFTAHGLLILTFALWDEHFRPLIGKELGLEANAICCDVMGDLRLIRNWIVHNRSTAIKTELKKFKSLQWPSKPGPFQFCGNQMEELQHAINTMQIWLR